MRAKYPSTRVDFVGVSIKRYDCSQRLTSDYPVLSFGKLSSATANRYRSKRDTDILPVPTYFNSAITSNRSSWWETLNLSVQEIEIHRVLPTDRCDGSDNPATEQSLTCRSRRTPNE